MGQNLLDRLVCSLAAGRDGFVHGNKGGDIDVLLRGFGLVVSAHTLNILRSEVVSCHTSSS